MNRPAAAVSTVGLAAAPARWRVVLSVFKLRIGLLIMLTAIGGLAVEWVRDAQGLAALWNDLLDNRVSPNRGLMVSLL